MPYRRKKLTFAISFLDEFLLNLMMLEEEDIAKSYSREEVGWIFESMFANRIVGKWNVLPDSCMICRPTTLNDFKTKIKLQLEPETQI